MDDDPELDALLNAEAPRSAARPKQELDKLKQQLRGAEAVRTEQEMIAEEERRLHALLEREAQREQRIAEREKQS